MAVVNASGMTVANPKAAQTTMLWSAVPETLDIAVNGI